MVRQRRKLKITITLPEPVVQMVRKRAEAEQRTFSNMLLVLITPALKEGPET